MEGTETLCPNEPASLLSLPPELRNNIYQYALLHDIDLFAENPEKSRLPPLLKVCQQLRNEYAGIFYDTHLIRLDAYYAATDTWCAVVGKQAKQAIIQRSTYVDLCDFWSLASARRYCQRVCYNEGNVQRGIMTVVTGGSFRRWQWSVLQT